MAAPTRVRRAAPPFRRVVVAGTERRSPFLVRVRLTGPDLEGFEPPGPAGSVRLLVPDARDVPPALPSWTGNAFFNADGTRPVTRTLTPLRFDGDSLELDVDVVLHGEGPMSEWADSTVAGDHAAVSGPGRGYTFDEAATRFVLAGDESAIPAIGQLLDVMPGVPATVFVELTHPDARVDLVEREDVDVQWLDRTAGSAPGDALVAAVLDVEITSTTNLWVAGEAAAVQRIRRHLFGELAIPRSQAMVRGYWKHGRSGDEETPEPT